MLLAVPTTPYAEPFHPGRPSGAAPCGIPGLLWGHAPLYRKPPCTSTTAAQHPLTAGLPGVLFARGALWAAVAPPPPTCRPLISGTWLTCCAMSQTWTTAQRTLRPPQGATYLAHQAARPDPIAGTTGGTAAALRAAPPRAAKPQNDRRPVAPAEAPRRLPKPANTRPPTLEGGKAGAAGAGLMIVPVAMEVRRTADPTVAWSDTTSNDRRGSSGGPPYAYGGSDRAAARHDDRPRRGTPNTAPERGLHGRRDDTDRRQRRSPSPETAWCLRYDAPDTQRRLDGGPKTAPHARPAHMEQEEPPRKGQPER